MDNTIRHKLGSVTCTVSQNISAAKSPLCSSACPWELVQESGCGCARARNSLCTKALHQNVNEEEIKGEQMLADRVHPAPGKQPSAAAVCPGPC